MVTARLSAIAEEAVSSPPETRDNATVPSIDAMIAKQEELAARVSREDRLGAVHRVAGVDVAYAGDDSRMVCAAAVLDATTLATLEIAIAWGVPAIAYQPGLFSFRELPVIVDALDRLAVQPDLIVCDGQGIAHPRRFGLASHLGVARDIPTIGCAKTRLVGTHDELPAARGSQVALIDGGEVVGAALRTQDAVRPVYASIGHRISLETACHWILRLAPRFRLPETTRAADHAVKLALAAE